MEHSWGRDVFLFGLGGTGATLAARFPPPNHLFVLTNEKVLPGFRRIWQVPADTQPDAPYFAFTLNGGPDSFPYGQLVNGDVPL